MNRSYCSAPTLKLTGRSLRTGWLPGRRHRDVPAGLPALERPGQIGTLIVQVRQRVGELVADQRRDRSVEVHPLESELAIRRSLTINVTGVNSYRRLARMFA